MEQEIVKCDICMRDTTYSLTCQDCTKATNAMHKWMRSLKEDRKKMSNKGGKKMSDIDTHIAVRGMVEKISEIGRKTLKEWGIK